jgi:hypothetical protein
VSIGLELAGNISVAGGGGLVTGRVGLTWTGPAGAANSVRVSMGLNWVHVCLRSQGEGGGCVLGNGAGGADFDRTCCSS